MERLVLQRRDSSDRGASLVEYSAMVLLVAAVLAALVLFALPGRVGGMFAHGMDCILQFGECESEDSSDAPGESTTDAPSSDAGSGVPAEEPIVVEPVFFFGDDEELPELAPAADAPPDEVFEWWNGLSETERDEVIRDEPEHIRGLDGIPAEVRNRLNREFLTEEVDRMLEDEGFTREQVRDHSLDDVRGMFAWGAPSLELWEMVKLEAKLNRDGEDYYLLALDPEEERAIVSTGNPDTADNVATLVPGTGIEWTAVNGQLGRAENLHAVTRTTDTEADHAVVAWLGYDAPSGLAGAAFDGSAEDGKGDLQDFQYGLRTTHEGDPSTNTLIGHSYGSVVVGHAARDESGVDVDNVALVGSPGVGGPLSDMNFDGDIEDVHVVLSEEDWINDWNGAHSSDDVHGTDATYVDTEPNTEHDEYFNDTGTGHEPPSTEMRHLGRLIAGRLDD